MLILSQFTLLFASHISTEKSLSVWVLYCTAWATFNWSSPNLNVYQFLCSHEGFPLPRKKNDVIISFLDWLSEYHKLEGFLRKTHLALFEHARMYGFANLSTKACSPLLRVAIYGYALKGRSRTVRRKFRSFRLGYNKNYYPFKLCIIGLKPKAFEDFSPPPGRLEIRNEANF